MTLQQPLNVRPLRPNDAIIMSAAFARLGWNKPESQYRTYLAEQKIAARHDIAGIGVGTCADYGHAERLYVLRGYVPDGRGLCYQYRALEPMEQTINDDDLVLFFTKKLSKD